MTVLHSGVITPPTLTWVWGGGISISSHKGTLGVKATAPVSSDPAPVTASEWQVDTYGNDFASPLTFDRADEWLSFLIAAESLGGQWDTDYVLDEDTDFEVRARYSDDYGLVSDWSDAVRAKTAFSGSDLVSLGASTVLLAEDESGNDQHLAYWYSNSSAGVPSAVGATIPGCRFPYHEFAGGADDYGVLHDNRGLVGFGGGETPAYTFSKGGGGFPNFRIRLRGYLMEDSSPVGFGIMGIGGSGGGGSESFQVAQVAGGNVKLYWRANSSAVVGVYGLDTGVRLEVGEEFDLEVEWDGADVTVNGGVVASPTPPAIASDIDGGMWGHHSRIGPTLAGTFDMLIGILLECEFEWAGTVEIHCNFADPAPPDTPTLTKA